MTALRLGPAVLDLELYDLDGHAIEVPIVDEDDQPLDVSAYTWAASWRASRPAPTSVPFEVDNGGAATGLLVVHVTSATMAALGVTGVWDLQGTLPASDPLTILTGSVAKTLDVTRPDGP